jgi:hypothetical protein
VIALDCDIATGDHNRAILNYGQSLAVVQDEHQRAVESGLSREATGSHDGCHIVCGRGIHFHIATA